MFINLRANVKGIFVHVIFNCKETEDKEMSQFLAKEIMPHVYCATVKENSVILAEVQNGLITTEYRGNNSNISEIFSGGASGFQRTTDNLQPESFEIAVSKGCVMTGKVNIYGNEIPIDLKYVKSAMKRVSYSNGVKGDSTGLGQVDEGRLIILGDKIVMRTPFVDDSHLLKYFDVTSTMDEYKQF